MSTKTSPNQKRPTYRAIPDDGADYKCDECGMYGQASLFWFAVTPNGKRHINHKDCYDKEWLAQATYIPRPYTHYSQVDEQE